MALKLYTWFQTVQIECRILLGRSEKIDTEGLSEVILQQKMSFRPKSLTPAILFDAKFPNR